MSAFRRFRAVMVVWTIVLLTVLITVIAFNANGPSWLPLVLAAMYFVLFCAPFVIYVRIIGSAESILDTQCDPEAFVRRCDEMNLSDSIPRNGLYRWEAVLLHRYGIALVDVGRTEDAAVIRRRIEDGLDRRKHPLRNVDCSVMVMNLADLCARLGDANAAWVYAGQFYDGIRLVPKSARSGKVDKSLDTTGDVTIRSSMFLFLSERAESNRLPFTDSDIDVFEGSLIGHRLAAEARMALAKQAALEGDREKEMSLLRQVAGAAPKMRVGKLAERRCALLKDNKAGASNSSDTNEDTKASGQADANNNVKANKETSVSSQTETAKYESLCLSVAVDVHAPIMKVYGEQPSRAQTR